MRSGSLLPGNENDAEAYHDVHLLAPAGRRRQGGRRWRRRDSSYLPHHSIPPIRSWPGPRIVWNCVNERITPVLQRSGQVPLLIGCDCSVVDRTTQALLHASSQEIHILHIDGDFDDSPADGRRSQSAASCAVWLLTNNSPFWAGSALRPVSAKSGLLRLFPSLPGTVVASAYPFGSEGDSQFRAASFGEVHRGDIWLH